MDLAPQRLKPCLKAARARPRALRSVADSGL